MKKTPTVFVLALEIASIVILHAVKINQTEKTAKDKEISRSAISLQTDSKIRSAYSFASFK